MPFWSLRLTLHPPLPGYPATDPSGAPLLLAEIEGKRQTTTDKPEGQAGAEKTDQRPTDSR